MKNNVLNLYGIGKVQFGASIASLISALVFFFFARSGFLPPIVNVTFFAIILAWSIAEFSKHPQLRDTDPKEIVIDEFLGMYLCLLIANAETLMYCLVLLAIFRIVDILKIWPINYIEKKVKGSWGILADDLAAGLLIGIAAQIISSFLY